MKQQVLGHMGWSGLNSHGRTAVRRYYRTLRVGGIDRRHSVMIAHGIMFGTWGAPFWTGAEW